MKLYIVSFLLYWFGFLIMMCDYSLENGQYGMLLFSIPFWIVGIFTIYYFFIKKDKR